MIYEIKTYSLIGENIRLFKERPDLKVVDGEKGGQWNKIVDGEGAAAICGANSTLVPNLETNKNSLSADEFPIFLPYFADVTQDIPGYFNLEPDTYKNCQLMAETHGSYLQFFDHDTKKVLRIAINSNTYSPLK